MKSPEQLSQKLARQWSSADHREQRLLGNSAWPIRLTIGRPGASELKTSAVQIQSHFQSWRQEAIGQIQWSEVSYQAARKPVTTPEYWLIHSPSEWIAACRNQSISKEFKILSKIVAQVDAQFHSLIVRQRSLWLNHSADIIIQCAQVVLQLKPGMAKGRPLRAITIADMDSKFLETYRSVLIRLLNIRYNLHTKPDNTQIISLEQFLDAAEDKKQWLLVIPLADNLLPYQQLRLRASELATVKLPGSHLLVIENEQCRYHLPSLNNTIAILGAGLNLSWMNNPDFQHKAVAYWGDIDSWGLKMLAKARQTQPKLSALLMNTFIFQKHQQFAVPEPQNAGKSTPEPLTEDESQLYQHLIKLSAETSAQKNRLEQEFIPATEVKECIRNWYTQTHIKYNSY
jgi:hypothetical protein